MCLPVSNISSTFFFLSKTHFLLAVDIMLTRKKRTPRKSHGHSPFVKTEIQNLNFRVFVFLLYACHTLIESVILNQTSTVWTVSATSSTNPSVFVVSYASLVWFCGYIYFCGVYRYVYIPYPIETIWVSIFNIFIEV